nr:MAG: hypothetical protein [Bacteriophage sp.]UVX49956.1 MAG: hypothetical protein [Bacteriophage sp.]UVX76587.1 MAG: hypothetical protein [Bacteriophage sp.]UVX78061.1 MAG: hypothetical protein [Bacteriophage sp.]UWG03310.1 MAG: hypothetical protein [Bacteriophage sp.]
MDKELLKKFLNHSIAKSDGKINISVLDMQSESLQDEEETEKRLNETFETLDKMLLQDGHKKIIESDYYNIYSRKDDSSELFVLQNKDTCVTLIELI